MLRNSDFGFSLIELLVVLLLLALVGSSALVMVQYPLRQSRRETMVARLQQVDSLARSMARRGQLSSISIDCDKMKVELKDEGTGRTVMMLDGRVGKVPFHSVYLLGQPRSQAIARISYETPGVCRSYAISIGDRDRAEAYWIIFAGLSGESLRFSGGENELLAIMTPAHKK